MSTILIAAAIATVLTAIDWFGYMGVDSVVVGFEDDAGFHYGYGHEHGS